jgi:hypothetical protein
MLAFDKWTWAGQVRLQKYDRTSNWDSMEEPCNAIIVVLN